MRRFFGPVLAMLAIAACGRSGLVSVEGDVIPTPAGGSPTPTVVPSATPDLGDGHDGALGVPSGSQTINACYPVANASTSAVVFLGTPPSVPVGRRLLVMQVQDDFATAGTTADVTAPGTAGQWEVVRVTNMSGSTADITPDLANMYRSAGTQHSQACTVPEYTTVDIGGTVTATPWDGATGGVVAFYASSTVAIGGSLTADQAGFRGGPTGAQSGNTTTLNLETSATSTNGGGKGEGLDGRSRASFCRGAMGNGAGGGNQDQGGGAGGGGGGAGGIGGSDHNDSATGAGRGGGAVVAPSLLTFGGGGGAGHNANGAPGAGGSGGGLVFVIAQSISGSGSISADGQDGSPGSSDGAGGGGAGGLVWIHAETISTFAGTVSASGGAGGDVVAGTTLRGTGGGGGGGRFHATGFSATTTVVGGGANGVQTSNGNDPHGAMPGAPGSVE